MDASEIDRPEVIAEVRAAFERYEQALIDNDVPVMNDAFWHDPRTVRFGLAEVHHGYDEIASWRGKAEPVPAGRVVEQVTITTFGAELAVVDCLFRNGADRSVGRQSQTWARVESGWRIVRAHVSMLGT